MPQRFRVDDEHRPLHVGAERLTEACGPGMPGPYREVKKVGCQVGARCGGGVKTPPYKWKIQWQQTQSVRAGHARPLRAA